MRAKRAAMAAEFGGQVVGSGVEGVAVSVEFCLCTRRCRAATEQSLEALFLFDLFIFFICERTLAVLAPVVGSQRLSLLGGSLRP